MRGYPARNGWKPGERSEAKDSDAETKCMGGTGVPYIEEEVQAHDRA
jgi:hypothetical protein